MATRIDEQFTAVLQRSPAKGGKEAGESATVQLEERL